MTKEKDQNYNTRETQERFDAMLKGALKSPPKPLKDIPKTGAQKRQPTKKKKNEAKP